jgi:hypothetical protein
MAVKTNTNGFVKTEAGWMFRVAERTEFRQGTENAAWYSIIVVEAGDYPARFSKNGVKYDGPEDAWWAHAALPGRRIYDHYPTMFAGSQVGAGSTGPVDEPATYYIQSYAFSVR